MAQRRVVPVPQFSTDATAADISSITEEIIAPKPKVPPTAPAVVVEEPVESTENLREVPDLAPVVQPQDIPPPVTRNRTVSLPPAAGFDSGEVSTQGFRISLPTTRKNAVEELADQRRRESEDRSLFEKVANRPFSGTFAFLGGLIFSENMSDIPEIMHGSLDMTAAENGDRILEKGLKGLGVMFTVPSNFVIGIAGAEDPFSLEAVERGAQASARNFADTFSLDDYLIYDALAQDPSIMDNPEKLQKLRTDFTESGYAQFVREIQEGRQVSDAKIIAFGFTSAVAHTAEFVVGGGGISKSSQFVIKTTTGAGKLSLGAVKALYKAPIKTKDGILTIFNLARGGGIKAGIKLKTEIIKLNPVAIHNMKSTLSQRNFHNARLGVLKTEITELSKKLDDLKGDPNITKDTFSELTKRLNAIKGKESAVNAEILKLDKGILAQFGVDHKKLNDMLDFTDMYKATAKQLRQNIKGNQKNIGKISKQELEEAAVTARNAAKHIKNLRKDQTVQFAKEFGIPPERVGQLREVWHDLLAVAKGRKDIKNILPVTQQLFTKGRGISTGVKSDPVLIEVQKILQNLPPSQRFEPLKALFTKAYKNKTGFSITQVDDMSLSLKKMSGVNDDLVSQIQDTVVEAIAKATNRISAVEKAAIDQSIQIRGGLERLRQASIEKFGKDITQLSRKQIRELSKPIEKDLDELISVRDLIVAENAAELNQMKHMFKKVFGVDLKNFDRADMMNRAREFELLKRQLSKVGAKASTESSAAAKVHKDFIKEYGITPQQFQQVEQLAADIHKTPWIQRFSPEFSDKLDYFATLTGGVKYRQFRRLIKDAPADVAVPSAKFLKTQLVTDITRTLRSHGSRLEKIGGSAIQVLQKITRRDEEARRMSGVWKETFKKIVVGLNPDEIKAWRIALKNDSSTERMMASISQFGDRIRSGVVAEAAKNARDLLDEIYIIADDVGVNVAGFRKEYFPVIHKYSDMFTNERTREAFINKLMKEGVEMSKDEFDFLLASSQINTGDVSALAAYASDFADLMVDLTKRNAGTVRHQFATREQAAKILEGMGIARGSRASKNLTLSRHGEGLPGAVLDPVESINTYIERAANTINDQVWFTGAKGATQDKSIRDLIKLLGREDHKQEVSSIFNDIVNAPKPLLKQKSHRAASTIRALNTPKLAFMAINNSAQGFLGTLWATDFKTAIKSFHGAFKSQNREWARRSGAVFDNMELQIANESGVNSALSATENIKIWQQRFLKWNLATTTEIHNRTTAALGGKMQVEHIAAKIRRSAVLTRKEQRLIRELVFEKGDDFAKNVKTGFYDANPDKWDDVLSIAGQRLARRTQLDPTGIFTREFTNSPLGSVWLQYKSFAINHAKFMWQQTNPRRFINEILLDPALTKTQKGIAFSDYLSKLFAYQVAGELIGNTRTGIINLWREDKIDRPEGWERIVQNFMYVGGLGIVSDVANIAINGNKYQAMGQILGPSGSDLATMWTGNMSEKASVVIEKIPIPIVNKSLSDMVQGK